MKRLNRSEKKEIKEGMAFARYISQTPLSSGSKAMYTGTIFAFLGQYPRGSKEDADNFIRERNEEHRNYYVYAVLRKFFQWRGWVNQANQLYKPRRLVRKKAFTAYPVGVLNNVIDHLQDERFRVMAMIQRDTGAGAEEAIAMKWGQVYQEEDGSIRIIIQRLKTMKERRAYIAPDTYGYLSRLPHSGEYVFMDSFSWPAYRVLYAKYSAAIKDASIRAGVPTFTSHDFRRSLGDAVAAKFGLRTAQLILGHASIRTTEECYVGTEGLNEKDVYREVRKT